MGLTTLTQMEQSWMKRARRAVEDGENWEACNECRRYHPAGHDDSCDDVWLPGTPEELLAQ